ncbi:ESX secretion-associated protein EspG [Nocardia crassostreae]|uniref:ESX secretion-associated protein EspG n=1 Tax=Nocardia crassostreae TaxID=53428 RepID=UPI0008340156|nr:ESX secretion-associated protein EspG [Nocardia crassostreae]
MRWELTADEFKALCNRYADGAMPPPLTYTSRTRYLDDFEHELAALEVGLRDRMDSGLAAAFETIAHPEVAVYSSTWCDTDTDNPEKRTRVHGARRGWSAVMITQKPGETIYHSNGYTLTECEPDALPALIVQQLPDTQAGSAAPVPIVFEPPERDPYEVRQMLAFDSFDDTAEMQGQTFWARPAEWTGFIRVRQCRSIYGPRGVLEASMMWRDLPGDGRYLIDLDEPETRAIGAGPERLAKRLGQSVDRVLRHMEERGEELVM